MSEFALLYRSTQEAHREAMGSPEKAQQSMTKRRAWFKEMAVYKASPPAANSPWGGR